MKNERNFTVLSLIINTFIVLVKLYGGIVFNSYTCLVSSYYTLTDMIEEFLSYIGSVINNRRLSKKEPFGYGKFELSMKIVYGVVFILVAIFIIIKSLFLRYTYTDLHILAILVIILLVKVLLTHTQFDKAKEYMSNMLMDMAHSSYYDAFITILSIIFIVLSSGIEIFDMFGSIFIGLLILYKGINIVRSSIILIKGQNDKVKEIIKEVKSLVAKESKIKYNDIDIINVSNYYKVTINLLVDDSIELSDLISYEIYLKRKIKNKKLNIKYIDFDIYKERLA